MRIAYGKIGRSMPLSLDRCGNLGGDVEMAAVVKILAERHPDDEFWLVGRNTGENPAEVGLPPNVVNPWSHPRYRWSERLLEAKRARGLNRSNLSVEDHLGLQEIYDQLTLPTIRAMDGIILWAGQHGTTNVPLPGVRDPGKLTKPHDWSAHYCSFLLRGVNLWRDAAPWNREEVWLNSDPRNYLKLRDLKWPLRHPVLAQYTFSHRVKHARYGDPGPEGDWEEWSARHGVGLAQPDDRDKIWHAEVGNVYSRLEVNGLMPGTPFGDLVTYDENYDIRDHFGMFINETRRYVREDVARVNVVRDWVLQLDPAWMHGTWSQESLDVLGRSIKPAPWEDYYPLLHTVRCTFTTPASGTGWATAKPWEAFAAGTVCFFHPAYDTQDNVLGDAPDWLRRWLRVDAPEMLRERVRHMNENREHWLAVIRAQRAHFDRAVRHPLFAQLIEERIWR